MSNKSGISANEDQSSSEQSKGLDGINGTLESNQSLDPNKPEKTQKSPNQPISLLKATLEAMAEGIVIVDLSGQIITFNQKFVQMWNIPNSLIKDSDSASRKRFRSASRRVPVEDTQQCFNFIANRLKDATKFWRNVEEADSRLEAENYDIFELKDGRIFESHIGLQWLEKKVIGRVWSFRDITERKQQMEMELQASLARFNRQVRLSTEVAQESVAATDLTDLFRHVVTQINEEFGFYHTQLFRYQTDLNELVLAAGYGERGQQMLAEGNRIQGGIKLIRLAAATSASIIRSDVSTDSNWVGHPLLPETRGEIAVPIKVGKEDAQAQITALKNFIYHGFDGIVVTAMDSVATGTVAIRALKKGIPVVSIMHDLGDACQTSLIYTVEREMGYLLGQQAGNWATKHITPGQTLKLGLFTYQPIPQVKQREDGIIEGIKSVFGGNIEIIGSETANDSLEAWPIALNWLQVHPDLNMIVGYNDATALGAYQAVIAAGKDDPHTFFVGGIDAVPQALAAIRKRGAYQATVDNQPKTMGIQAIRTVVAAIKGQTYDSAKPLKCTPVNSTNLDEFLKSKVSEVGNPNNLVGLDIKGLRIGLSVSNSADPFFAAVVASAKEEAERLGIELVINDSKRVLGVLDVQSNVAGLLGAEDQLVLEGIAAQVAVAIESASLREGLEEHLHELNELHRQTSRESWQTFQASRQHAIQGYLYDHKSTRSIKIDELQLPSYGIPLENEAGDNASRPVGEKAQVVTKPVAAHGEIIGGLGIQSDPDKPLTSEEQTFLDIITEQVAEALERTRLLEQTQKRAIEMETVAQVSAIVSTILTADQWLQEVVDLIEERFGLYQAHIYLLNENGDALKLAAGSGEIGRQIAVQEWSVPLSWDLSPVAQAARTRQTTVVNDVAQNPNFLTHPLLPETRAEMAVPMIVGDIVLGVFDVQTKATNHFTPEDVNVQTTLAAQVAVALRNASLFQQTQTALAEVKQSQQLLQITIDAAPDWIFIKDREYRYRLVNRGYANRLRRSPESCIGKDDLELGFSTDRTKEFWADDQEVMDSGKSKITESELTMIDGQWVFLSTVKIPLRDAQGNVWGVLGFVRDITQREQLLAETATLYRVAQALTQMDDERTMFEFVLTEYLRVLNLQQGGVLLINENDPTYGVLRALMLKGKMVEPGLRIPMANPASQKVVVTRKPVIIADALDDPLLEPIREFGLEMGYKSLLLAPIIIQRKVIGMLGADSTETIRHFTDREVAFIQAMADQLGVVIQNRRLLTETQTVLAEVEAVQRRYTIQAWEEYQTRRGMLSHEVVREGISHLGDKLLIKISQIAQNQAAAKNASKTVAINTADLLTEENQSTKTNGDQPPDVDHHASAFRRDPVEEQDNEPNSNLVVPLTVRGETIGVLGVQETTQARQWLPEEIDLVVAIAEQFAQAAETLRLIDETQQRAAREKRVNEIGEKIQAAQSLEEALKIAVKEVGLSLQTPQTMVKLELINE